MLKNTACRLGSTKLPRFSRPFSQSALLYAPKIAVIGSGPSAFYTSLDLLKRSDPDLEVDIFERNPCPFGLVRYGVAPDHPEVKSCQERFHDASEDQRFKFFGNVNIGTDIKLQELYQNYNAVVYAYGSDEENKLGIAGEDHPAVINSKAFVGWYNGDPKYQDLNPPLEKVKEVTIVGNGNVAMDILRILLAPPEKHWASTDITNTALEKLKKSTVTKVNVTARRGFLESKFTNKEFREVLELKKDNIIFTGWCKDVFGPVLEGLKLGRVEKRRLQLAEKYTNTAKDLAPGTKTWSLDYLLTPLGIKVDSQDSSLLKETIFKKNELVSNGDSVEIKPTNQLTFLENQLLILSIGYKGEPLAEFEALGIPFDPKRGKIPNIDGKIVKPDGVFVEGSYCVGWIANGSQGSINSSVMTSSLLAETIWNDWQNGKLAHEDKAGRAEIQKLLSQRGTKVVDWTKWTKIEQAEKEKGFSLEKDSEKITDFNEMIAKCT